MTILIANCPRCGAERMTFDVRDGTLVRIQHDWQHWFEAFCVCRNCGLSTVFVLSQAPVAMSDAARDAFNKGTLPSSGSTLNSYVEIEGIISLKDRIAHSPPEAVPEKIAAVFNEGATAYAVQCWNAAGTMFRLCVDLATRPMLPPEGTPGIKRKQRRDLGLRLPWLFAHGLLPRDLEPLSACIREDGNDGAHEGTLTKVDAEDLLDFTKALLERIYTEPARIAAAERRRKLRRGVKDRGVKDQ